MSEEMAGRWCPFCGCQDVGEKQQRLASAVTEAVKFIEQAAEEHRLEFYQARLAVARELEEACAESVK